MTVMVGKYVLDTYRNNQLPSLHYLIFHSTNKNVASSTLKFQILPIGNIYANMTHQIVALTFSTMAPRQTISSPTTCYKDND